MIRTWAVVLVTISVASMALAKPKHCVVRVYAQANPRDGDSFASPMTAPISGARIFVQKIPAISEYDVVACKIYPAVDGTFGAVLQLDDHGRIGLETLSIEQRGKTVIVTVNNRPVTELLVDRRVSDGQLYIPAGLTADDVRSMAKNWPQIGAKKRR